MGKSSKETRQEKVPCTQTDNDHRDNNVKDDIINVINHLVLYVWSRLQIYR